MRSPKLPPNPKRTIKTIKNQIIQHLCARTFMAYQIEATATSAMVSLRLFSRIALRNRLPYAIASSSTVFGRPILPAKPLIAFASVANVRSLPSSLPIILATRMPSGSSFRTSDGAGLPVARPAKAKLPRRVPPLNGAAYSPPPTTSPHLRQTTSPFSPSCTRIAAAFRTPVHAHHLPINKGKNETVRHRK